ncbi:MAG: energy-coupling factor ABC transporter permease [Fimbriiglobus sp.]
MIWAVHISDGVLPAWVAIAAGVVAWVALLFVTRRITEADIPKLGVLTAAFFVGSQLHIPIAGVSSAHLLLNGILGVMVGWRAVVVVALGLVMQVMLFGHGGWTTLGVNLILYTLPVLPMRALLIRLRRSQVLHSRRWRGLLTTTAALVLFSTLVVVVQWAYQAIIQRQPFPTAAREWWLAEPSVWLGIVALAGVFAYLESRWEKNPDFPLGVLLGGAVAYMTVVLNLLTLLTFATDTLPNLASLVLLANLPVILLEALITGFLTAYLGQAKPEWLQNPPSPPLP